MERRLDDGLVLWRFDFVRCFWDFQPRPEKSAGFPVFQKKTLVWANYNDLTATSLEIMVSKGNHPQMALIQVSELL